MFKNFFPGTYNNFVSLKITFQKIRFVFYNEFITVLYKIYNKLFDRNKKQLYKINPLIKDFEDTKKIIKPIIFASACVDNVSTGGMKYNGGIKELNYLIKILSNHGYEAYMVTYDGKYEPWLIEHLPHISLAEFHNKLNSTSEYRCITSWIGSKAFIDECPSIYFWDMELAHTSTHQFATLAKLYSTKIRSTAAISRKIQAWHMTNFERGCVVIPNICDESIWYPIQSERIYYRVGYMNEGHHTHESIAYIKDLEMLKEFNLEFVLIEGVEHEVLSIMRTCNIFLSLNIGKDKFWGEGCPRTLIEALSVGCIPIAFDNIGNNEIIINNFNGFIVPRYRIDLMAQTLHELYTNHSLMEKIRNQSGSILNACHKMDARWPAIKEFLDL